MGSYQKPADIHVETQQIDSDNEDGSKDNMDEKNDL